MRWDDAVELDNVIIEGAAVLCGNGHVTLLMFEVFVVFRRIECFI